MAARDVVAHNAASGAEQKAADVFDHLDVDGAWFGRARSFWFKHSNTSRRCGANSRSAWPCVCTFTQTPVWLARLDHLGPPSAGEGRIEVRVIEELLKALFEVLEAAAFVDKLYTAADDDASDNPTITRQQFITLVSVTSP